MYYLGYIISVSSLICYYALNDKSPIYLVDISSFFFVVGLLISMVFIFNIYRSLTKRDKILDNEIHQSKIKSFNLLYRCSIIIGIIGFFFGLNIFLLNYHDDSAIGPGISFGLLSLVYSLFVAYFIFLPFEIKLRYELTKLNNKKIENENVFSVFQFIIGVLMFFTSTYSVIMLNHKTVGDFFDIKSMISIVLLSIGAIISSGTFKRILLIYKSIFSKDFGESISFDIEILYFLMKIFIISGLIVSINSIIHKLVEMKSLYHLNEFIMVFLLPNLCSLIFVFLFVFPFIKMLSRAKPLGMGAQNKTKK